MPNEKAKRYIDSLVSGEALPGDYDKYTAEEILHDITEEEATEVVGTPAWSFAEADAVARSVAERRVSLEELVPGLKEWKSEQMIRDAIKHGDISVKQFVKELQRRGAVGTYGVEVPAFVDDDPVAKGDKS